MRGGEKMEIGSLGVIHSLISQDAKQSSSGKDLSGFSSLFTNLMANTSDASNAIPSNENTGEMAGQELLGLVQFLQTNDILELENGMELLGKVAFQSDTDIIKLIEEQLNMTSEDLIKLLSNLYEKLVSNQDGENLFLPTEIEIDKSEESHMEIILSLIDAIASLQKQDFTVTPDKDFGQAMKALKLFDLLSAHQDSFGKETRLREFLKNINEKLEMKLDGTTSLNREAFLQKTFRTVLQEMNGKNPAYDEKMSENVTKLLNKAEHAALMPNKVEHVPQGFIQFQQLSRPEQLTLVASQSGKPVSAEQLIEQFQSIISKSQFLKNGGTQKLFIKLNPEHLGALRVELIQKDSTIIARILTSTSTAKEMMESHLNGLKQAFSSQNIQVEKIEIAQQFTQQERAFNREQQQGQGRHGQHREEQQEQQTGDFNHSFEEALLNTEA